MNYTLILLAVVVVFFVTMTATYFAVRFFPPVARLIDTCVAKVGRQALPSTVVEVPKFAAIRVLLGVILTWRAVDVMLLLAPSDYVDPQTMIYVYLNLVTAVAVLVGILTQYTLIVLMIIQWQVGDIVLGTSTLANMVAAMLALLLFVVNSGRTWSMDGWVVKHIPRLHGPLLYYRDAPTPATITAAKWLGLFSFWLVCLYSLTMHLNEPAWRSGTAGPLLLDNNYMSRPFEFMGDLFTNNDWAVFLARVQMWSMLPWYLLLVPCVLIGRLPRIYAIAWGFLFFIVSLVVLELSWLAEIELLLWAAIFWSRTGITTPQLSVVFDDKNKSCYRTMRFIRAFDVFERTKLVFASGGLDLLQSHGISPEQATGGLHGIDEVTGRVVSGYDTYVEVSRRVVLFWPGYPILLVGKWLGLGAAAYRWSAQRRPASSDDGAARELPVRSTAVTGNGSAQLTFVRTMVLHVALLGVFYLAAIPSPDLGYQGWRNPLAESAHVYGIAPINVFNETDLRMAENWFTLSLLNGDRETLLPIFADDGSRLAYHVSDRVYYGKTLPWRRLHIDMPGCFFDQTQDLMRYLTSIYLRKQGLPAGEYHARYRQYYQAVPDPAEIVHNKYERKPRQLRCTDDFTVTQP